MTQVELTLRPEQMQPAGGLCWTIRLPDNIAAGDTADCPTRSTLDLREDGIPLGPAHADHSRIRSIGRGLFSHWHNYLYFSSSNGSDPRTSGRAYAVIGAAATGAEDEDTPAAAQSPTLFPRLAAIADAVRRDSRVGSVDLLYNPEGELLDRVKMLEAKVEYLLDELYTAKSYLRYLLPDSLVIGNLKKHQLETFDFQWKNLPYHDLFLSNPEWRDKAVADICHRLEKDPAWFRGKRILDCGCGPGRHAWAFSKAGGRVTAFDASENGLAAARAACDGFPDTVIEKRNILEKLPYSHEFDLVWCYGVIHCTGDTFTALSNIASHVALGGLIYVMVYAEPDRTDRHSYQYFHEVFAIRHLIKHLPFEKRADFLRKHFGERYALGCFDAISSAVNDLYTFEELGDMLRFLGFGEVKRTAMDEASLNIVATRERLA